KDYERATKLYRRALAFDPRDTEAFTALERVHRVTESWEALLELYREAAASAPDPAEQKSHLAKRAAVFEQLARLDDAVGVHREILEVDPTDRPAMEAIDRLLVATSRWSDLAEHLRFRIEDASDVASKNGLRFRLGNVLEEKLEDASGAVDAYEQILESDPGHADAIAALEILVQDVEHRLRITHILEPVYRRGDQWRKLIAIYEAQVELASDASEKVRLLREIAGLHEKRGQQKTLAFHAWARAYVEEPGDDDARGHLERLAADLGAWDDLVDTFEQAIEKTFDQALKASLLTAVARVHDEQRGDPRKAIDAYERLLAADETDASPLEALEGLHTLLADWAGLVKVLERKVERATDPVDHGDLLRRMGSIQEELLADVPGAIDSYRRAVDVDGSDSVALEALDRLYGQTGDHASLGPVLRRRMETTSSDPDLQVELGLRLGELAATELRDTREAIDAYTQVLAIRGDEVAAVGALTKLYEQERMWPELLSNLALAAALAQSDAERVIIKHRIGEIHEKELSDLAAALETYADVLAIDGDHAPTLDALSGIARDEEFRGQAASLLEPRYRTAGRWDDLAKLLELVIDGTSDPELRARELSKLALVHEDGRKDLDAAFGALLRALADRPSDEALVAELERLAARLRTWDRLADALGAAGASAMDPRSARSLYLRLARISENELKDDARAIEALKRAADATGDDDEILAMLDRLFTKTSSWVDLADVLERRIGLDPARQPSERAELLCRLGRIRLEQFHDKSSALSSFREVLERDPHHGAALTAVEGLLDDPDVAPDVVDALDAAYRETASLEKLAALYDTRVKLATTGADRIAFLREQAELYESRLGNQAGALSALKRATREEPGEEGVFKDLERLAGAMGREGWTALSGFVEQVLEEKGESLDPAQVRDLHLRAARWYRDHIGDSALAEEQLRAAIERDRDSSDAHSELADLLRASGQHRPLVEALRDWARVELDADARRKRLRNAAALAEDQLGDRALAGEALSQILDDDESDGQALEELARIREAEGRFAEVADLLERRARVADDPATRVSLYHRVAGIAIGKLEDSDRAVTAYENVLTEDPGDLAAIGALERIHEASARWKDLRDVITRRLENATTAEDRIAARVRLARLAEERFGQRDDAIEQLREILAEDSRNALAADELERLYAVAKRWSDLTELLEQRAGDAASIGDLDGELSALVRLGEVYQTRLNDDARAVEIYERVLSRQPKHPSALAAVARLHEKAGDWAKAAEALDTALGLAKPGKDGAALALRLAEIQSGKLKDAAASEATLYKALDLDPTASEPAVILMERYERAGEHAKLAKILSFEEERTEAPDAKVALLRRIAALAADKLDDPARAADALERATKLAPDNREVLLPLCDLYIRAGRQADAVPVLQKIIASYGGRRAKELATYHHRLGQALEGMGDQAAALEQYDAAFRIDLTSVPVLRDLGRLKYKAGDVDGAQKAFRALLLQKFDASSGISKADVYFYLGDMSSKSGDKAKAISMLERSIAEDKEHANARALLRELKGQ
ncbi:MAG: tetratricopeptide repeat protein, partial [Deltaproteobacteria bacterium]|nr:tetratricopeptide repeat protein [Deltaproteobacteria bacterium]